jgi:hypothetical protein
MGMQQVIRISRDEPHQMPGFEPDALVPYRTPEEEQRAARDLPTRMSQFIAVGGSAQVNPTYAVLWFRLRLRYTHTDLFFLACLKAERPGLKPRKTRLSARPLRYSSLRRVQFCQNPFHGRSISTGSAFDILPMAKGIIRGGL